MKIKIFLTIFLFSFLTHSKVKTSSLDEIVTAAEYFVHFKVISVDSLKVLYTGKSEHIARCTVIDQYKGKKIGDTISIIFTAFNGKPSPSRLAERVEYLSSLNKSGKNYYLSSPYMGVWRYKRDFKSYFIKNENSAGYTSNKLSTEKFISLVKDIIKNK